MRSPLPIAYVALALLTLVGCHPQGTAGPPPPPPVNDTSLGSGDVFQVRVYDEDDLSTIYSVTEDGSIDFPLIGRVEVGGLEPPQAAERIATMLVEGGILTHPSVSILVKEVHSKQISVIGAVTHPGSFPMRAGLTVVQAVSLAGGFTSLASRNDIVVTREIDGELHRYRVHAERITEGRDQDFPVQARDIIYVPERIF